MTGINQQLADFDPDLPLERASTLPSSWYRDPAILDLEVQHIFRRTWQPVGLAHQVNEPGAYFTTELHGEPIVVLRDEQGELCALANVCRHRGARILQDPCGQATRLRCRYHGWTYDLSGGLRGVPEFEGVENFPREENGLPAWPVATWGPLIWVHLGQPIRPLNQEMMDASCHLQGTGYESLVWVARQVYDLACNWKVYVDNYLDGGYHINTVHPGLAGILDYSRYRTEIFPTSSVQLAPLTLTDPDDPVAQVRTGNQAQYWWFFPNLMLNLTDGVMDTNIVVPLAPDRCRVIFDFYFTPAQNAQDQQFQQRSVEVSHQIQQEDVAICEEVQRGLNSATYHAGRFSVRREAPVYAFHRHLARCLKEAAR